MLQKTLFLSYFFFALFFISCNYTDKGSKTELVKSTFEQIKNENGYNSSMFDDQLKNSISIVFVQKEENNKINYLDSVYTVKEKFFDIKYFDNYFSINSKSFEYNKIELISSGSFDGENGFDYYFYLK